MTIIVMIMMVIMIMMVAVAAAAAAAAAMSVVVLVLKLGKLVHYMNKLLLDIYLKIWTFKFCIMVIADLLLQK